MSIDQVDKRCRISCMSSCTSKLFCYCHLFYTWTDSIFLDLVSRIQIVQPISIVQYHFHNSKTTWLGVSMNNWAIFLKKKPTIMRNKSQMCTYLSFLSGAGCDTDCYYRGLWYSKMNILRRNDAADRSDSLHTHLIANFSIRKDFLPAFPHEAEKSHVPFQQSRLLLSHLGFINYEHLKDKTFQMLNKTPALFRDLRLLDRKQG